MLSLELSNFIYSLRSMIIVLLMLLPSEIFAQCNADFTFISKICAGSKVSFIAQDSGNNTKYYWDFGDPFSGAMNEDTTKNTDHFFKDSGIYIITLIVTTATITMPVAADKVPNSAMTANMGWSNASGKLIT